MSVPIIPEDAPFTEEQRIWLNGFFAGWMGVENTRAQALGAAEALLKAPQMNGAAAAASKPAAASAAATATATATGAATGAAAAQQEWDDEGDYPWHDSSMDMDERMQTAEERPKAHKLMAAMAQLDCGACGYMCDTYAFAIADGEEKDLTLCSPGGRETARMLKKIVREEPDAPAAAGASASKPPAAESQAETKPDADESAGPAPVGRSNPIRARIDSIHNLNGEGSAKYTVHAEIDLSHTDLTYRVGDSLGVYPTNCPELVEQILRILRAHGTEHVVAPNGIEAQLRDALMSTANLTDLTDETVELVAQSATEKEQIKRIRGLLDDDDQLDQLDVLDLLQMASTALIDVKAFSQSLAKLQPRLYSIASSPQAHPGKVHLTIAEVTYELLGRMRKGVASTMFARRLDPGDTVPVYVHSAADFTVPKDASAPMIMIGPGTGIAPFRAFLEERQATGAKGKNWLFFGDQHEATDFLYRDEFEQMQQAGLLTKLSTAFSRDQEEKIYVQHRMSDEGAELFEWLEQGAYFFVCGDAKRMAGDVDKTLHALIAEHGKMSKADAKAYVKKLRDDERYVRDVY